MIKEKEMNVNYLLLSLPLVTIHNQIDVQTSAMVFDTNRSIYSGICPHSKPTFGWMLVEYTRIYKLRMD